MMLPFYNQIRSFFHIHFAVQLYFLCITVIYFVSLYKIIFIFAVARHRGKKIETSEWFFVLFFLKASRNVASLNNLEKKQCHVGVSGS